MGVKDVKNNRENLIIQEYIKDKNVIICNYMGINDNIFRLQLQELGLKVRIVPKDFINKVWLLDKIYITGMALLIDIGNFEQLPRIYKKILENFDIQILGISIDNRLFQLVYFESLIENQKFFERERLLNFLMGILIMSIKKVKKVLDICNANN